MLSNPQNVSVVGKKREGIQTLLADKMRAKADDISNKGQRGVWLDGILHSHRDVIGHARMLLVPEPHKCHSSAHGLGRVSIVPTPWSNKQQVVSESRYERQKSLKSMATDEAPWQNACLAPTSPCV